MADVRDLVRRLHDGLLLTRDEVDGRIWKGSPELANLVEEALNDAGAFLCDEPAFDEDRDA
jgi:hypothetical protein